MCKVICLVRIWIVICHIWKHVSTHEDALVCTLITHNIYYSWSVYHCNIYFTCNLMVLNHLALTASIDRVYAYCPRNAEGIACTPTQCLRMRILTFFAPHWSRCLFFSEQKSVVAKLITLLLSPCTCGLSSEMWRLADLRLNTDVSEGTAFQRQGSHSEYEGSRRLQTTL